MIRTSLLLFLAAVGVVFATPSLELQRLSTWHSGIFNQAVGEISAYDPATQTVFTTNVAQNRLNMFDISNPSSPVDLGFISLAPYGGSPNSVTVKNGIVATAVQAVNPQDPGAVVFFTAAGLFLNSVTVGAIPDMLTFSPDGQKVLVCNEAEPNSAYTVDPDGSVSIIDISGGVGSATVTTATFTALNGTEAALRASGIRIYGNNGAATAAQDFEPEYLTISADGLTAWVTLQENNAIAILDIPSATFTAVVPLGYKNWNTGPQLDACDRELPGNLPSIHFQNWPVYGMYQPDAIASYVVGGQTYLITANEGDAREYSGVNNEQIRVNDIAAANFDAVAFPNAATLRGNQQLGRLRITNKLGNTDADPQYEELYAYGARSFSIRNASGALLFDSGDDLEVRLAAMFPTDFNCTHDAFNSFDTRSDDKGPEPEGVTVANICDRVYAFIALERIGGVIVYDVTNPVAPVYVTYATGRNFAYNFGTTPTPADLANVVELGPEQTVYVSAENSPNGRGLLLLSNEVSGSVSVYQINRVDDTVISGPGSYCVTICNEEPVLIPVNSPYEVPVISGISFASGCHEGSTNCNSDCTPGSGDVEWSLVQISGSSQWYLSLRLGADIGTTDGCFCVTIDQILPVEFGQFAAVSGDQRITLNWNTISETGITRFDIERNEQLVAHITGQGNSSSGHSYAWDDRHVVNGIRYEYTLFAVDVDGARTELGTVNATPGSAVAGEYRLIGNFPNPFNPNTNIRYTLGQAGFVTLRVYDLNGRAVATLVDGAQEAGLHTAAFDASALASGIYVYRLDAEGFSAASKMVLMK